MRHISFFLTQDQVRRREKTVTRRGGWHETKPGDLLVGVVKGQGLKAGERVEPLCIIEVVSARREPLDLMITDSAYGYEECRREGFPTMRPVEFATMYREHNGGAEDQEVTRIEFKYREDVWAAYQSGATDPEALKPFISPNASLSRITLTKEPTMAKSKDNQKSTAPTRKSKKGSAAAAVEDAEGGPKAGTERPGVQSDPNFDGEQAKAAPPPRKSAELGHAEAPGADEYLPAFPKVVFVPFSREELAAKAVEMAKIDYDIGVMEGEMKEEVGRWKQKINDADANRRTISAQVHVGGEEKEINARKRIIEATQTVQIFDADSLEIIEERKLSKEELQTELRFQENQRANAKVVQGNWPKDRKFGETAAENPEQDAKNEAALKNLAKEAKA